MSGEGESKISRSAKLVWQKNTGVRQEFILHDNATTSLGREPGNDIVLPTKNISKQHAIIFWKENQFAIADQGSTNGTIVNGVKIKEQTFLKDGDRIEVGDFVLSFYYLGDKSPAELKTRRLVEPEPEAKAKETVISSAVTGKLPGESPTMILPGAQAELAGTMEIPPKSPAAEVQPPQAIRGAETRVLEPEPAVVVQPVEVKPEVKERPFEEEPIMIEKAQEFTNIDEVFSGLLSQQSQIVNAANQAFKEKAQATKASLGAIDNRLGEVAGEMSEFEQKVSASNLAEILNKLARNPNDVTLLVELAKNSDLIRSLMREFSNHATTVIQIKKELDGEIAKYSR